MTGWFHRKTPETSISAGSDSLSDRPVDTARSGADPLSKAPERKRTNLTIQLTSFVGRQKELSELQRAVGEFRLVTLTGVGGGGKTRLALQVASNLLDSFSDGAWFVDLAPLSEGGLIPQAIAGAIGVREQPGRALLETIADYLQQRSVLLIVDNCEHLVDSVARTAEALLVACARLHVLATSRERLRVDGEHVYQVPPLELPRLDAPLSLVDLEGCEAVRFFVDRAVMAVPSFSVNESNASAVAQLCNRLDGIPLALELAAAQLSALTPNEILTHIGDRFQILAAGRRARLPRQRALWATLDWSYQLLDETEKALFRRLSIFSGFDLEAVGSVVASESIVSTGATGLVSNLAEKSLVVAVELTAGHSRYRLLETVREYGLDRLRESGEDQDTRRRHALYYLSLGTDPYRTGDPDAETLERMELEHDNARTAMTWAMQADRELACQFAVSWASFWLGHGHYSEGRQWLVPFVEAPIEAATDEQSGSIRRTRRAQAAYCDARLAFFQGELDVALSRMDEALQIAEQMDDKLAMIRILNGRGGIAGSQGDAAAARSDFNRAVGILRDIQNAKKQVLSPDTVRLLTGMVMSNLGQLNAVAGDYPSARTHSLMALEAFQHTKDGRWVDVTENLGELALEEGDLEEARQRFADALSESWNLRDPVRVAGALRFVAGWAADKSAPGQAVRLESAGSKILETVGAGAFHLYVQSSTRTLGSRITRARSELGPDQAAREWELGHAMSSEEAVAYAIKVVLADSGKVGGIS